MLLMSFPSSYENLVETLLYGRESLTMKDVLATLNSRELKKRTQGTKEEAGDGLYVRGRDCLMKKSSGFVKKGKRNKDSDFSDDERNAYFGEALVVVRNDKMTELVMDSYVSYHMTHRKDFLYDFKVVDGGSVQLDDNRTCTIKGTKKVKIQLHDGSSFILEDVRIKVSKGCRVMMTGIKKKNYVYTLEAKVMTFGRAQGNREAEVFQVSNDDAAVAQRCLEDKQLEEKTNTDCLVKEQENVHLGKKVRANIMVTGVPGQEGAEGNVAEKKKVKESMEANLRKLLKYNAWSTRWSPIRGSSTRKMC
nr:retrovirus-related Pol polyprotein from transposon TNT 1-94 [Tanacetum cinerariifolium]